MFNSQNIFQFLIIVVMLQFGLQSLADIDAFHNGISIFSFHFTPYIAIKFLDDLILLFACFAIFSGRLLSRLPRLKARNKVIDMFVCLIVMIFILSKIANESPLINLLLAAKYCFFGFLIYYLVLSIPNIDANKIVNTYLAVIFIQLPVIIGQIAWNAIYGEISADSVTGTFLWANLLSYGMFFPLFYVGYMYLNGKKKEKWRFLSFAIIMISGFGFYAILMFPLLFYFFNIGNIRYNPRVIFRTILIMAVFLGLYSITIDKVMPESAIQRHGKYFLFSPRYLYEKLTVSEYNVYSGSARMLWFDVTSSKLDQYAFSPLIGMGPGMYASLAAYVLMPYTNVSIYNYFLQLQKGMDAAVDSQIIPLWGEVGYIGLSLFVLFFLYCTVRYYRLSKRLHRLQDKALAITVSAGSIYLLIGFYINHLLEVPQIVLPLFLFMGLSEHAFSRKKNNSFGTNEDQIGPPC